MKTNPHSKTQTNRPSHMSFIGRLAIGASLAACGAHLHAADTKVELTPEQAFEGGTNTYNNWVELSTGAMLTKGSKGEAQQRHHLADGMFGGIEDLHYQKDIDKNTLFSMDGRALLNSEDYKLSLRLARENLGFVRFGFQQYRTWYNGNGGLFRPDDVWISPADDSLGVDRGEISFQAGLTLKDVPQITFEYLHQYRNGQKSSTIWGPVNIGFYSALYSGTRGIAPAFYDIDEQRDIFKLDVKHRISATDFGVGLRYDTGDINNSRKTTFYPGEPGQWRLTNREGSQDKNLSVHGWTETWLKNKIFFSSGFIFANLDDNFSGSRVFSEYYDSPFAPNAAPFAGYYNLDGVLHKKEYVMNLNLMATPLKNLTVAPSIRVQKQDWNSESFATQTLGIAGPRLESKGEGDTLDVQERLDVRYTGVTNWVFFARGELGQGEGNLKENGGLSSTPAIPAIQRETDSERCFQKYSIGARWYPVRSATLDFGGYYKKNSYDYDHLVDSTTNNANSASGRYPAYLVMQDFETYDGNVRLTLRPFQKVTLVSRYEHQLSTIHTKPDSISGLSDVESAKMTSHIFAQNVSYVPWSRLSLQAGINYVVSETKTPMAGLTQAILNAQNNYWTFNFNSTFVVDDKTDLNVGYFYYKSDNYSDNSLDGQPLGAQATEHGVTALATRRLTQNLRLNLRYAFFHSEDVPSGGHNDYDAHVIFSSLQYRF